MDHCFINFFWSEELNFFAVDTIAYIVDEGVYLELTLYPSPRSSCEYVTTGPAFCM
jgi:hypothetical protein